MVQPYLRMVQPYLKMVQPYMKMVEANPQGFSALYLEVV
jgi:hypothetical protein